MSIDRRRVWYRLVDKNRKPFQNCTASSIKIPVGADVDDLMEEVKNVNYNNLFKFDTNNLVVYSSTWTPGSKELPLKASSLVDDKGMTEEDAVLVVVLDPPVIWIADVDKYVADWFSRHPDVKQKLDDYEDTHTNVLLTYRLDDRLTKFDCYSVPDTKVMVGVSGSGKTRTIFELLYHKLGFYFTFKSSDYFGSEDLVICKALFASHLKRYTQYFRLLLYVRHSVITQLMDRLGCPVHHVLFAQFSPRYVFGCDLFKDVFEYFAKSPLKLDIDLLGFPRYHYYAAVDEIQLAFKDSYTFDEHVETPFFTPMMDQLRCWFDQFIVSGINVDYAVMKARLTDSFGKCEGGHITEVGDFALLGHFDSETTKPRTSAIRTYVEKVLIGRTGLHDNIEFVSEALENFEFCHGRPGLCADILEALCKDYHRTCNVEELVERLLLDFKRRYITNKAQLFSFMDKSDWRTFTLDDGTTLSLFLENAYVSTLIMPDRGVRVSTQDAVDVIERGIGYRYNDFRTGSMLKFTEPLVNYLLPDVLTLEECRVALLGKLGDQPDRACGGKWFEFLVAYGFASWNLPVDEKPRQSLYPTLADYIKSEVSAGEFYLPEACCGPDIFYLLGRTLFIIKVDLCEKLVRGNDKIAADTTNPKLFYCHRNNQENAGVVLKSFKKQRMEIDKALSDVDFVIKRYVVTYTATNATEQNKEEVVFIDNFRRGTGIEGFELFGDDGDHVWQFVDKVVEMWKIWY